MELIWKTNEQTQSEALETKLAAAEARVKELEAENVAFARNLRGKQATTGATYEHLCQQLAAHQEALRVAKEALGRIAPMAGGCYSEWATVALAKINELTCNHAWTKQIHCHNNTVLICGKCGARREE